MDVGAAAEQHVLTIWRGHRNHVNIPQRSL